MNISLVNKIKEQHSSKYSTEPILVKSPGRANIIGEHTDYNHGLVLPFAIEKSIYLAISQNNSQSLNIEAIDINENYSGNVEGLTFQTNGWTRYFKNVLVALNLDNRGGLDITFGGDLPSGAGVSSSSAITCGFLSGLNKLLDLGLDATQLIDLASQAENGIGLNGGIMDQTAIIRGIERSAILIDFNKNVFTAVPLDLSGHNFYLIESGQKHNLVDTEYNKRRNTCETAVKVIQDHDSDVHNMADITKKHINDFLIDGIMKKRCLHVIEENIRVRAAENTLINNDLNKLGELMTATHQSLSSLYEVSTKEIDWLVDNTLQLSNVLGSRIMGGGFGGCTISLVKGKLNENDKEELKLEYKTETGLDLAFHMIKPSKGVTLLN